MSRREISMTTAIEGTAIAVLGLVSGMILSFALGWVLIFIINRQSFGWTLLSDYPWLDILQLGTSVVLLAFLTSQATGWLYLRKFKLEV